ncbi:hypothetical protein D3C76_1238630 [compost metagenome]
MDQYTVGRLAQLEPCHLPDRNFAIGYRYPWLDRAAPRRTEHQRKARFTLGEIRRLWQCIERTLRPLVLRGWLHFQVLPGYQGFQVRRFDDAQCWLNHPELRTNTSNTLRHFSDTRLE